ncbi:progesterone-induced-blocking factor 1 [Hyalella azteca]|uniref:Progesterone-induced-blocking factor 1 n=1 Tax=Hyalella azteca TaxID=294128 RepID=A0A8B7PDQ8_HYAAZ|nr:progesterone-induced-blocking factor 1 [Hyalella azteca]
MSSINPSSSSNSAATVPCLLRNVGEGDRAELLRTIELLKLQVAARDEQLARAAAQREVAVARVAEQKNGVVSAALADVQRLQESLAARERETSEIRERAARELATLTSKCALLQANMTRLGALESAARASLLQLHLRQEEYDRLINVPQEELSLAQYASLRLHEQLQPLRASVAQLQSTRTQLQDQLQHTQQQLHTSKEEAANLRLQLQERQGETDGLKLQVSRLRDQIKSEDFRVQNYDRVKNERETFHEDLIELRKKHESACLELESLKKDHFMLTENLDSTKILNRRLENELASLKGNFQDLQRRTAKVASESESASAQLRAERDSNHELHGKYIAFKSEVAMLKVNLRDCEQDRNVIKSRFEESLQCNAELERRLEDVTARNKAIATELEKCQIKCSRSKDQYEEEISELRSEVLSATKLEKTASEKCMSLKSEVQRLRSDLTLLNIEKDRKMSSLQAELREVTSSLDAYKNLEKEYEESLHAIENPEGGNAQLFPSLCLRGNKVIEQIVKLSGQVLKLQRENTDAKNTIRQLTEALEKLGSSLYSYKCAVSSMAEPERSLHEKIISQQDQITSLNDALQATEAQKSKIASLSNKVRRLSESLEACGPQANELKKLKDDVNAMKDVIIRSLNLDGSIPRRPKNVLPSAISITKNVSRGVEK